MRRFAYSFLGALAVLAPTSAWAQSGTTGIITGTGATTTAIQAGLVVKREGKQLKNEPFIFVTRDDCSSTLEYEFSARFSAAVPVTEVWVGVGGEDCSSRASRERTQISSTSVCRLVGRANSSLNPSVKVSVLDLFSSDSSEVDDGETTAGADGGSAADDAGLQLDGGTGTDPIADAGESADVTVEDVPGTGSVSCDEVTNLAYKVFFIPLPQPTNVGANRAYDPLPAAGYGYSTLVATFTLYTEIPAAPTSLSNRDGESELAVGYRPVAGAPARTTYRAYFDWGTGEGECGSGALVVGQQPPSEDATVTAVDANGGKASLKDLDGKGIPIDSLVAATVVTVDPAGNESNVEDVVCVKREETINFIDRCKMEEDCKLSSCSVRFPGRPAGWLGLLALVATGMGLLARRRLV